MPQSNEDRVREFLSQTGVPRACPILSVWSLGGWDVVVFTIAGYWVSTLHHGSRVREQRCDSTEQAMMRYMAEIGRVQSKVP